MHIVISKITRKRMYTNLMGRGWNEVWGRGDGNETLNILNQSREGKKGERERTVTQIGRE